jgi:putative addiction module component (TIGR02574 family)
MTPIVERIIAQIDALTLDERGELACAFLCSLEPSEEVTSAWESEVHRRLIDTWNQKQKGIPAKELSAELRQRSRT